MQQQITIADIFREYGDSYISRYNITGQQKGLIRLLSSCRTSVMGSHYEKCDHCRYIARAYNSCRNRHCPSCQHKDKLEWMGKTAWMNCCRLAIITWSLPYHVSLTRFAWKTKKLCMIFFLKQLHKPYLNYAGTPNTWAQKPGWLQYFIHGAKT
jgi:hypothetical protein